MLRAIFDESVVITDKWDHYFSIYEKHFQHLRNKPVRMLEIGVYKVFSTMGPPDRMRVDR